MVILRVGLSAVMLVNYLWHYPLHAELWGPNGQLPYGVYINSQNIGLLDLFRFSPSPLLSACIYYAAIAVALLYLIGFQTRVMCWLFAITAYSMVQRNWMATDAGETLVVILAFFLCFADTTSFSCRLRRLPRRRSFLSVIIGNMLHNSSRFLICWQMCMVYFWATFYKLGGSDWRNGTALYYVLHLDRFTWFPAVSHTLAAHALLVALATYFTLLLQLAFPFLVWNQRAKPYLIVAGVTLHASIAVLLGLLSFSITMIIADVSLLSDNQIARSRWLLWTASLAVKGWFLRCLRLNLGRVERLRAKRYSSSRSHSPI